MANVETVTRCEVVVLYADFHLVRVSWDDKETLKRDHVQAIAVIGEQWRQCSILHDYYQLVWTGDDCCLTGHDGDYGFYPYEAREPDWRFPFIMPTTSIEFEGSYVGDDEWVEVLKIYADPDGGMF